MCGICGFAGDGTRENIEKMTAAMIHRGPDDGNVFMDASVALGHRRLSVIDLAYGAQPMRDPASGAIIVYNGEIYNHMELRREMEKAGRVFRTDHSDTETALSAFLEWGPDCFAKFNGMFALAVYTPSDTSLWLARDRFGEKPLFYCRNKNGFAFASEIGALKQWSGFDFAFDEANVQRFFAWNYLPGGATVRKDCRSLPPGSWLKLDLKTGELVSRRYWRFRLKPDESLTDEAELAEELRRLLVQAVKRRLVSDVPLGVFLSGGVDSSAILAACAQAGEAERIRTFTIGFREKSFDESEKARAVADWLHVRNEVEYLTEEEMKESVGTILSRMSEPFGDASLIPTAKLSAFARRYATVALSGDGGDELFGGYDPLAALAPAALYRKICPPGLHALARRALAYLPASDKNMSLDFKLKRFARGLSYPADMQLPVWMSGLEPDEIREFFERPLSAEELFAPAVELYRSEPGVTELEQALRFFTDIYLPDAT
ncbi:MAG: asparagine synthase (glutamine-hydrolyzing), partial [Desulfovibrio sp.]|nr:asparagine synthase (glutamine-hydrolyzing) [Desulfovibrio sp.]